MMTLVTEETGTWE